MNPDNWLLGLLLRLRARTGRVRGLVRRRTPPRPPVSRMPMVGGFRVASVQMRFELCDERRFVEKVSEKVRLAVERGAELVVFPEETGTMLLGMVPAIRRSATAGSIERALGALGEGVDVPEVIRLVGRPLFQVYRNVFAELAARYRCFIAAGSLMLPTEDERVQNVACLFAPSGLLGMQPKCHLLPLEFDWGLDAGDDLLVFVTPLGRLAVPVCMDASYFETFRILALKGAEVVLVPTANPEAYHPFKAMRGVWPRVQESQTYGVVSAMVGEILGLTLAGKSAVYAPLPLSPRGDGILAEAETADQEELVVADLDLSALRALREESPLPFRPDVYRRYFPTIYHGHWRGGEP